MRYHLGVIWAELLKSLKIFAKYPVELFGFSIFPIFSNFFSCVRSDP